MDKVFCIDFGNTNCKLAFFNQQQIEAIHFFTIENAAQELTTLLAKYSPSHSIISSVVTADEACMHLLTTHTICTQLHHTIPLPFSIAYKTPDTLGKDRLALAAAACQAYPTEHTLVIACGSCITYNFIEAGQCLLGGAISPGLQMRFKAMHQFTNKLPLAPNIANSPLIGIDTMSSLQSGVINGVIHEIEGTIDAYAKVYDKFNVVLTGGDMPQLALLLKRRIFADANFLFKGLHFILQHLPH
jgi:type III pantothenate kinase